MNSARNTPMPWWGFLAWVLMLVFGLIVYPHLPSQVATHFGASGAVNGTMPRLQAVLVAPALGLALIGLWYVLFRIDPRRSRYEGFWSTYRLLGGLVIVFLAAVQVIVLGHALTGSLPVPRLTASIVGLLILLISNSLPRLQPNWWLGVRTPWTLSSEETWRKTHLFAGRSGVAVGIVLLAASWIGPLQAVPRLLIGIVAAWAVAVSCVSYWYYIKAVDRKA